MGGIVDLTLQSANYVAQKQLRLIEIMGRCDVSSQSFIKAQIEFLKAEEKILVAAGRALSLPTNSRHLGMAMAQAPIEPLMMIAEALDESRKDGVEGNAFITAYFGRTLELARDSFGFLDLSISGSKFSLPKLRK
jgi:hypothetical protein